MKQAKKFGSVLAKTKKASLSESKILKQLKPTPISTLQQSIKNDFQLRTFSTVLNEKKENTTLPSSSVVPSAESYNLSCHTTAFSNQPTENFTGALLCDYPKWNSTQVALVLSAEDSQGGANLQLDHVKRLYDAGFDGKALFRIVKNKKVAIENMVKDTKLSYTICQNVSDWVTDNLAPLPYHWTCKKTVGVLCKPETKGGASIPLNQSQQLSATGLDGKFLLEMAISINTNMERGENETQCLDHMVKQMTTNPNFKNVPEITCRQIVEWVIHTPWLKKKYHFSIHKYDLYRLTGKFEASEFPYYLEKLMGSIDINMMEPEIYDLKVNVEKQITRKALGNFGVPNAEWPYVFSGNQIRLDWRFSTDILPSDFEAESIAKIKYGGRVSLLSDLQLGDFFEKGQSTKSEKTIASLHEYIVNNVLHDNRIAVLLALSGAGKSHTLFYLATSNAAFTLPLDFGSTEDLSNKMMEQPYGNICSAVMSLIDNPNNDPDIYEKNKATCEKITSILATSFTIRAMILLKILKQRRAQEKSYSPSQWIKYLYNGGGETVVRTYQEMEGALCEMNADASFLLFVLNELQCELDDNPFMVCRKLVLTVDEINSIVHLGYGQNTITPIFDKTELSMKPGSVATLLFRLLEKCLRNASSVLSGTKINNALLDSIVSSRMKDKIDAISVYGPPTSLQLEMFAKKYFFPPKIKLISSDFVFKSICSILEGRRRIFMQFLTGIIREVHENPYPYMSADLTNDEETEYYKKVDKWKIGTIFRGFAIYEREIGKFQKDLLDFLEVETEFDGDKTLSKRIKQVKKEIALHLLIKNRITEGETRELLSKHHLESKTNLYLTNAIINFGIGFGQIENQRTVFVLKEVLHMIHLNRVFTIEDMKEFINKWLKETLYSNSVHRNSDIGTIFEIIGALIIKKLAYDLSEQPLTSHPVFAQYQNTDLDRYFLPRELAIICSKHYWKYLLLHHVVPYHESLFRDVCVHGLDESLKVDVKTIAVSFDKKIIDVNMASKFITHPNHKEDFENNFNATDIGNAFLCNNLNQVQQGKEGLRKDLEFFLECHQSPSLRIVFDYTTSTSMAQFSQMVAEDANKKKEKYRPVDYIVMFGRQNPEFMTFFEKEFSEINRTLVEYLNSRP